MNREQKETTKQLLESSLKTVENINLMEAKLKLEEIKTNVNISIKKFQDLSEEIIRAWNAFMNKINIGHVLGLSSVLGVGYLFMKTGINTPFPGY